jgi:hypothetical protein
MTVTLSGPTIAQRIRQIRENLKAEVHQPVPEELISQIISQINKDTDVLLSDAGCVIALSLIEQGHNPDKIFVAEDFEGEYVRSAERLSEIYGFHHIKLSIDKIPPIMKFDYIVGNPPFQSGEGNGDLNGSGTGALWWKITQASANLLKDNGVISFITPTNILNGGDSFTKFILGNQRKLDLISVITEVNSYFPKVGTKICRWTAQKSLTKENTAIVDNCIVVNTDKTLKIYKNSIIQDIIQTLINSEYEKFDISVKDAARVVSISKKLQKEGLTKEEADKIAKDYSKVQTDIYPYPYNSNGKIKYGRVKWHTYGIWKMMIPHMSMPFKFKIMVSDDIVCDQSCDVQYFSSEEDAIKSKQILDNPIYRWVIEQTRVGGRMSTAILSKFPNVPIEEVLTPEQLSYIQSQL